MIVNRRHFLSISGVAAAGLALSACGSESGGLNAPAGSSTPVGTSTSTSTAGGESSGTAGGSGAELTQWYHEYGEPGTQEAVKKYAAAYDQAKVTVKWNVGDYAKLLSAALLTNDIPDVFESEMGPTIDMIKAGQVADLTDVVGEAKSKFNAELINRMTYEGKIYGIPQVVDMHLLYYRKSLLEKAGVQPPKTFEELVAAAKAVKTAEIGGLFVGNDGIGPIGTALMYASGNSQFDADLTKAGFLDDSFYQALVGYRDLFTSGALLQSASKDWFDGSPFINEETAMQWGGLWSMTDIQKAFDDDFGVLPFPAVGAKGKQATMFGAFASCVAAKSSNVEAAKAYAKWLWVDQTDYQVEFANNFGTHIPAQTELAPQCTKLAEGAGSDAAKILTDFGRPASDILWSGAMADAFSAAVSNVVKKKADPAKEMAAVGTKVTAELKRIKG